MAATLYVTPAALLRRIGTHSSPKIFDVRRRDAYLCAERVIAGARWRDHRDASAWGNALGRTGEVVVYCVHGEQVSQSAAAFLRSLGCRARWLQGGIEAFAAAGGPTVRKHPAVHAEGYPEGTGEPGPEAGHEPGHDLRDEHWCEHGTRWVTGERPGLERLACVWLIRRFLDPQARVLYVDPARVGEVAVELDALPFANEDKASGFDVLLEQLDLRNPALDELRLIVRGARCAPGEVAPEYAGLLAMSLGILALEDDDYRAQARGLELYDTLYAGINERGHETDPRSGGSAGGLREW